MKLSYIEVFNQIPKKISVGVEKRNNDSEETGPVGRDVKGSLACLSAQKPPGWK